MPVQNVTTRAVVLRRYSLGEADRIVVLLTPEHGVVRAVAKAARKSQKRFGGILDLLYHLEVEISPRRKTAMPLLSHARLIEAFPEIGAQAIRLAAGCYLAEVAAAFSTEDQADPGIFLALIAGLRALNDGADSAAVSRVVELQTLAHAGLAPRLDVCTVTGRKLRDDEDAVFVPARGGTVCLSRAEAATLRLDATTRRLMIRAMEEEPAKALELEWTREALLQAKAAMQAMMHYHHGRPPASRSFAEASARFLRERRKANGAD